MSAMPDRSSHLEAKPVPDCRISVVPVSGGWSVETELVAAPLMFMSGAKAEEKARALAQRVAVAGRDAKVLVHDRSRTLVGTWRYFARDGDGPLAERPVLADAVGQAAI